MKMKWVLGALAVAAVLVALNVWDGSDKVAKLRDTYNSMGLNPANFNRVDVKKLTESLDTYTDGDEDLRESMIYNTYKSCVDSGPCSLPLKVKL